MISARALAEYLPIRTAAGILRLLPRSAALAAGRAAGRLSWAIDRRHRQVALENLAAAYADRMPEGERRRLARSAFSHFGQVAAECLLMEKMKPADIERLVEYEGVEHIRKAFRKGKGVIVFSGHYGHWEIVALMQGWLGYPMALVTRPLDNPYLERLLWRGRTASGNDVIHKKNAVRGILKTLRHGWCVALVIDQDARGTEHVFVDFFGRPAATITTLGLIALKTGAPVIPVFSVPLPDGRYRISYLPELPVEQLATTGERGSDVKAITQACTRLIEEQVRARPECWLWMHRRWKRRPRRKDLAASASEPRAEALLQKEKG